ncbi:hypothetical protein NBH15_01250 [Parabacteroides sp. W1-Q-101]|uniref:hypothetical protein n=1 Tax=Parabacteroides TaxID=375288 RepID=UPI001FB94245|nr:MULTISPECIES: hypothetical protein [Parabacteroides]MCM0716895.1 hypothetical protein [Parabacteroides sp. W1-Q-101]
MENCLQAKANDATIRRIKMVYLQVTKIKQDALVGTGCPAPCRLGVPRPMSFAVKSSLSYSETG